MERGTQRWRVEVKDGTKPPSARKLTPDELDFASRFTVYVVTSPEDAAQMLRGMLEPVKGVPHRLQRGGR